MASGLGPVVFKHGKRAEYDALGENIATNALYFLEDTGEIYHGKVNLARGTHYEGIRGENETDDDVFVLIVRESVNYVFNILEKDYINTLIEKL